MGSLENEQVPFGQKLQISNQSGTARLSAIAPPTCWHFHLSTGSYVKAHAKLRVGNSSCKVFGGCSRPVPEKMGLGREHVMFTPIASGQWEDLRMR